MIGLGCRCNLAGCRRIIAVAGGARLVAGEVARRLFDLRRHAVPG
jgi:hypothetical protein